MKKLIASLLFLNLALTTAPLQAAIDCHVVAKSGEGEASLPWQVDRVNQGICGTVLFTLMPAPLKVTLSEPLFIEKNHPAMISGADYSTEAPWLPLGVVIDARAVEGCAVYIEKPQAFSIKALSFWVKDWDSALCDFQGRSILTQGSSAYVGDALVASHYSQLQICEGPNQAQSCTMAPLPPFAPPPKGPGNLKGPPKPPLPPGPGDLLNCSDDDQDKICDQVDYCDLSPNNTRAGLLASIMTQQCPPELKATPLCSQSEDLDGDGDGNACDLDADGDGFSNQEEEKQGSDPLDADSIPEQEEAQPNPQPNTDPSDPEPDSNNPADLQNNSVIPSKPPSPGNGGIKAAGCSLQTRTAGGEWKVGLMILLALSLIRKRTQAV